MTAQQIRNKCWTDKCDVLAEIAAQLAELNDRLKTTEGIAVALCASNDVIPVRVSIQE